MNKYLSFFLTNSFLDLSISIIFILNVIILMYLDNKYDKNDSNKNNEDNEKDNKDGLYKFKITTLLIAIIIMSIYIINKFSNLILTICFFIVPTISLIKTIFNIYKNKTSNFSFENKYMHTMSTIIYILFFSSIITEEYIKIFANIPHIYKEILIMLYLIIKIGLYAFLISFNILILISIINEFLLLKNKKIISSYLKNKNKDFYFIYYNFILYKKYNSQFTLVMDKIIFIILIIPSIILNTFIIIILKTIKHIKKILYKIIKNLENEKKWNKIIKKITNISLIISLVCVYILTVVLKNYFSFEIKETFSFISSVILIPLIYDSIKNKY